MTRGQTDNNMEFLFQHFHFPINYQSTQAPYSLNQTLQEQHSFIFQYMLRPQFTVRLSAIPCAEYRPYLYTQECFETFQLLFQAQQHHFP